MINLIDKYKGEFFRGGLVYNRDTLDPIRFAQDPTYLSFHVEFFFAEDIATPDTPSSSRDYYVTDEYLIHDFSHNGLFVPPKFQIDSSSASNTPNAPTFTVNENIGNYTFTDSAEDYLYAIGAVNKLAALRSFKQLLYSLQNTTPWYFQRISGAEGLYTFDPAVNTRKELELDFELLESIDQRSSLLADLYRSAAWDFERHREVLPYNLRTFKMRIHVFEMRNFNTYSGTISNFLRNTSENAYQNTLKAYWQMSDEERAQVTNVLDNQNLAGSSRSRGAGGSQASGNPSSAMDLMSAFNAISVRTYELGQCEFDFYSNAPNYLEELNVNDVPMSTFKFKVKVGTVRSRADYSFHRFVIDHVVSDSKWPTSVGIFPSTLSPGNLTTQNTFYEPGGTNSLLPYDNSSLPPGAEKESENYNSANKAKFAAEESLRKQFPPNDRIGGILGVALGALESRVNTAIQQGIVSRINSALLGNVYDNIPSPAEVQGALRGFLAGDRTIDSGSLPTTIQPENIGFENLPIDNTISRRQAENLPVDTSIINEGLEPLNTDTTIQNSDLEGSFPSPQISPKNIFRR